MTSRELLIAVLRQTRNGDDLRPYFTDDLRPYFTYDVTPEHIADTILASRDEETLNSAADDYEAATREQYPGAIYGAIRRIRAYKIGAYLRARAEASDG